MCAVDDPCACRNFVQFFDEDGPQGLKLLNHVAVTTVATYAYVNPVVAVALGVAFRDETMSVRSLVAAGLIIGAVVAMVSGRPRDVEESGPSPDAAALDPEAKAH